MANRIDPMCGLGLTPGQVEAQTRYVEAQTRYKDKAYYFCSEECRRIFEKNPEEYAGNTSSQAESAPPLQS